MKILAIKLKSLGDSVVWTPALRRLRAAFPGAELHVLLSESNAPLLERLPWLDKVWKLPCKGNAVKWLQALPLFRRLRAEKFDLSINFDKNERGAMASALARAKRRIGVQDKLNLIRRTWRKWIGCYHQSQPRLPFDQYEALRDMQLLNLLEEGLGTPPGEEPDLRLEIAFDPCMAKTAAGLIQPDEILCYIAASRAKMEWPLESWRTFAELAHKQGHNIVFCAGNNRREQKKVSKLRNLPGTRILSPIASLDLLMAVIARARLHVSTATGPMHVAAALSVPTVSLFLLADPVQWAPRGERHRVCYDPGTHAITPDQAWEAAQSLLSKSMPA